MSAFRWYHVDGLGSATVHEDSPAICARIDAGERGWFGTPEGAINHGGVIASAFERETVETFDAIEAITNGRRVSAGFITITKITAERSA